MLASAGDLLARACAERDALSPAEAARLAHRPGRICLTDLPDLERLRERQQPQLSPLGA
ncbi:hypothetical protein [Nonomuraea guangzhouensis]|uniref:Uncharacterized protein n=1 Tax=Nonomuraea guangzhouensis TaxID=1291555 RepID=A0ABW4G7D6_9ACTN|nr:hypothetical protein [Nonomuraea guangzhouensis]